MQYQGNQRNNNSYLTDDEILEHKQDPLNEQSPTINLITDKGIILPTVDHQQFSPQKSNTKFVIKKNLLCEIIRLKGQEKLLFVKLAKNKEEQKNTNIFDGYPYAGVSGYQLATQNLFNKNGQAIGQVIQNSLGVHLVSHHQKDLIGTAVSLFHDGRIFEGIYTSEGKHTGLGYQLAQNGNSYIGNFKEDVKNGDGVYYWFTTKEMYAGKWMGGLPHGQGTYISNDDQYSGCFSNGLKNGDGEQHFANGDHYIGQYVNGTAEGYGQYFWADSSVYKGDFKHGVRHGYGLWHDKKQNYKGSYRMDQKEGFGIYRWLEKKKTYKGQFREDFREGYGELYRCSEFGEQQLEYKGCWFRGKQNHKIQVNAQVYKQFKQFLNEKIYDETEQTKNKRIGHRNCIPRQ